MLMLILQNPLATDKQLYFNTSHVNVNHKFLKGDNSVSIISIHLMLMLITQHYLRRWFQRHFNTSHVNVNLVCLLY